MATHSDASVRVLGVCLGASTVSVVELEGPANNTALKDLSGNTAIHVKTQAAYAHGGNPRDKLIEVLRQIDVSRFDRVAATGRRFRNRG